MSEPEHRPGAATAVPTPAALAAAGRDARSDQPQDTDRVAFDVSPDGDPAGTGDDAVDEAMRRLVGVEEQDLVAQAAVFEDVHGALRDRLADGQG